MKRKFFVGLFLLSVFAMQALGQDIRVRGVVTDASDGTTLPGVTVMVKGTTQGTLTDISGQYELSVAPNATLVFSFVGMTTQEIPVNNRNVINVALAREMVGLDEFVVVAYGIQRREASTGAVSVLREEDLRNTPVSSPERLLQGKVAGLQMQSTTGQPGASSQVRIRGFSSINASNEPLYVVDGVPVASGNYSYFTSTGNIMASLNPGDIESITVLKDAAAASVYGSRAANGVILITTKRGSRGDARLNFRHRSGMSQVANDNDFRFMTAEEIYGYNRQAIINSGMDPATYPESKFGPGFYANPTLPANVQTFDWMGAAFRDANTRDYELSVSGANEATSYYASGGYMKQEGIMIATGLERYSFRSNFDQRIGNLINIGTNINATYTYMEDRPNNSMYYVNPFWASINILPWHLPYKEDGSYDFQIPSNSNTNFLASAEHDQDWDKAYKMLGSVYGEITPLEGLTIRTQNSMELLSSEGRRWWSPLADPNELGTVQASNRRLNRYTTTNTINYMKTFGELHNFRALVGQEAFLHQLTTHYGIGYETGWRIPYLSNTTQELSRVNYGFSEYSLMSFFGIFDYNFDNKYFLTASVRQDGNSKFGVDNRWATFWSVGGSWNLHRENFIRQIPAFDMLKLRASYGINGNDGIGNYDQYGTYGSASYNAVLGMNPTRIENRGLSWELNSTYNVGLDFALFRRLQGSIEYYHRTTSDMLLDMPISHTSGATSFRINIGELVNQGIEANASYDILTQGPVMWTVRGNIARNQVELTDLGGEEEIGDGFWRRFRLGGGFSDYYVYDYIGVNPLNGMAIYRDANGAVTQSFANADRVFRGKIEPDFFGGLGTDISWNGFTLSTFFEFKIGHYVYVMESRYTRSDGFNWGSNQNASLLDYWKEVGDIAPNPKPLVNNSSGANEWGTGRFLEKGDYLRLKDLTLSYQLPRALTQRVGLDNARIYLNAVNLYTWHDVSYWDPERDVTGGNYIVFPQSKTFSVGVELGI
jgi:TonB-linked SusC/RagA family outer membrane protein